MAGAQLTLVPEDQDGFADELGAGTSLLHGQYTISRFLNAGGFGITYLAKDSLDRDIVIKECFPATFCRRVGKQVLARSRSHHPELRSIVTLFVEEARSLAKLQHTNIVGVHQVFEENNTAYMALDYIEGRDFLDLLESEDWQATPQDIVRHLRKMLDAVGFVHGAGLLHRDIAPDNIILSGAGEPTLIDFGAAREQASKQSRVLSALRVVKDGYSPQEFYLSGAEQNASSDLYALAATFYHIITRSLPPDSQTRLCAVAAEEPDPYRSLIGRVKGYDRAFLGAIDQALSLMPKDRPRSAQEWVDLMERRKPIVSRVVSRAVDPSSLPSGQSTGRGGARRSRRARLLLGSAAIFAAATGLFAVQSGLLPVPEEFRGTVAPADGLRPARAGEQSASTTAPSAGPVVQVQPSGFGLSPDVTNVGHVPRVAPVQATLPQRPVGGRAGPVRDAAPSLDVSSRVAADGTASSTSPLDVAEGIGATSGQSALRSVATPLPREASLITPGGATLPALVPGTVASALSRDAVSVSMSGDPVSTAPLRSSAPQPTVSARVPQPVDRTRATEFGLVGAVVASAAALQSEAMTPVPSTSAPDGAGATPRQAAHPVVPIARAAQTPSSPADRSQVAEATGSAGATRPVASLNASLGSSAPSGAVSRPRIEDVDAPHAMVSVSAAPVTLAAAAARIGGGRDAALKGGAATAPASADVRRASRASMNTLVGLDVPEDRIATLGAPPIPARPGSSQATLSNWSVELPFTAASNAPVVRVNGRDIASLEDVDDAIRQTVAFDGQPEVTVAFGLADPVRGTVSEMVLSLPVVQRTALLNGMYFETRHTGEAWATTLVDMPLDTASDFQIGDRVAAYIPDSRFIDGRTSLRDTIEAEVARGVTSFNFAVERGGQMWITSLAYGDMLAAK